MQVEIRHQPSFAVARVYLPAGGALEAESGAMVMHSPGISVDAQARGGIMKSFGRAMLGGESFFITTYRARPDFPGWVDVAARLPGDIVALEVTPQAGLILTRGSWLANDAAVDLDTRWGGSAGMFGGEGAFIIRAYGTGTVLAACYGALDRIDLGPNEGFTIDAGHVVAYTETTRPQLRTVSSGLMRTLKSGEGMVFDFVGPGTVWTQSRNPRELISWIQSALPPRQ